MSVLAAIGHGRYLAALIHGMMFDQHVRRFRPDHFDHALDGHLLAFGNRRRTRQVGRQRRGEPQIAHEQRKIAHGERAVADGLARQQQHHADAEGRRQSNVESITSLIRRVFSVALRRVSFSARR